MLIFHLFSNKEDNSSIRSTDGRNFHAIYHADIDKVEFNFGILGVEKRS